MAVFGRRRDGGEAEDAEDEDRRRSGDAAWRKHAGERRLVRLREGGRNRRSCSVGDIVVVVGRKRGAVTPDRWRGNWPSV